MITRRTILKTIAGIPLLPYIAYGDNVKQEEKDDKPEYLYETTTEIIDPSPSEVKSIGTRGFYRTFDWPGIFRIYTSRTFNKEGSETETWEWETFFSGPIETVKVHEVAKVLDGCNSFAEFVLHNRHVSKEEVIKTGIPSFKLHGFEFRLASVHWTKPD